MKKRKKVKFNLKKSRINLDIKGKEKNLIKNNN